MVTAQPIIELDNVMARSAARTNKGQTHYLVTIDTEEEWDWSAGWPTGQPSVTNIRALPKFQRLCSDYGIRPTYFTDLAVLSDEVARQTLLEVSACPGVEIGMHIHPWNTPPLAI